MKRWHFFLLSFFLLFGIPSAVTATSDDVAEHVVKVSHRPDGEGKWVFTATLEGEENVRGDWSFVLDGHDSTTVEYEGEQAQAKFSIDSPGKHQLNVSFEGSLGDRTGRLNKEYIFEVPALSVKIDGSKAVSANLLYTEQAEGKWTFALGTNSGELVEIRESAQDHGPRFSKKLADLQPGTYHLLVTYQGKVNGVETGFQKSQTLHVDEQGKLTLAPGETGDSPAVITAPEKVAQVIENSKQGGKLPKTATSHPAQALIGLFLLLGGWMLLKRPNGKQTTVS
ncbi:LPXTG-motif cell wall-anchored protein [Planifilum fimeticola]|uniref:LPXTG-motif cell wall-anchored protein n=1 Tax=Planifilum fimeticola TaxID=201975 RepID=A0A2T0LCL8_9BACL|nr:LPXTG cell wall anchor domain-containing protein [Planifilum fimeticola]PRX39760.1 LPXTG-motif cell wall-anchored protein [Planifilum fimeticola]